MRHWVNIVVAALLLLMFGCSEEQVTAFQKTFIDKQQQYTLDFDGERVKVVTPQGSMVKPFRIADGYIELQYADPGGKAPETLLHFYQDSLEMELFCNQCAKYHLPSHWYLDVSKTAQL